MFAVALLAAIAWYPTDALSWSSNRVENEILQNGYSSFFRAAATNEIDYHAYYASRDPTANLDLLAQPLAGGRRRSSRGSPRAGSTGASRRAPTASAG